MNIWNCLKGLLRIQTKLFTFKVFLKFLLRARILSTVFLHTFSPRKSNACCAVFVFHGGISNVICDLVLYLLHERLNIPSTNDSTMPFHHLKIVVTMHDSAVWETCSQFILSRWIAPMRERINVDQCRSKQKCTHLFCAAWSLHFRFLLSRGNHDVKMWSKWSWIIASIMFGNLFNLSVKICFKKN